MTKKKKIIIILISALCLCAILFSVLWFVPVLRFNVLGVSNKTQEFLPRPKIVKGYYADQTALLAKERQEELYDAFMELIPKLTTCEVRNSLALNWSLKKKSSLCLEFRYRQVYEYTDTLGDAAKGIQLLPFDTIGLNVMKDYITLMPFLNGDPAGGGEGLLLTFDGGCASFQALAKSTVADAISNPMGVPRQTVNTQPIHTDQLLVSPDSMVLSHNGEAFELSDTQRDRIYAAFTEMDEAQDGYPRYGPYGQRTEYTNAEVYENMKTHPCLEFRYDQRHCFDGVFAQWYQAAEPGQETDWRVAFEVDSVVLILYETTAMIIYGTDGLYESTSGMYRSYDFGEGYSAFRSEVLSLMQ